MSLTIHLSPDGEARLRQRAAQEGQDPERFAAELVEDALREGAPAVTTYVRPTTPPAWLADLKPANPPTDGTNGMHRVFGKWPGDETEEELLALERQLDAEDAGRV